MAQINTRLALRNDSTLNWQNNADTVLLKGEIGIEFNEAGESKVKIGDGTSTWSQLPYFGGTSSGEVVESSSQVFQATLQEEETDLQAIARVVGNTKLFNGDIAIVKNITSEKTFMTAYVYSNGAWVAMDGNYNAENVYFDEDLFTTSAIGNISLVNGQATIATNGKNLKEVWNAIFVQEKNPKATQPSVSFYSATNDNLEVGSEISPSYSVKLNAGSYTYGPATGITASSWSVDLKNGSEVVQNLSTASGTFDTITLKDGDSYTYTATASYEQGSMPVTNTGNDYPSERIAAGNKSATSTSKITSYRNSFYGTFTKKDAPNSSNIRDLANKSNKALSDGSEFTFDIPIGALRTVIAYPATLKDLSAIKDNNDSMSNILTSFTKTSVQVEGKDGFDSIAYKVYFIDYANPNDATNKYTVII